MRNFSRSILIVALLALGAWLFLTRKVTSWEEHMPRRLQGIWFKIAEYDGDIYGVRTIQLSSAVLTTSLKHDDGSAEVRKFPIRRVSVTMRRNSESGSAVVFYGEPDEQTIARHRLQIYFGPSSKISVYDIVPTGYGEDHWFEVGEFVRLPQ